GPTLLEDFHFREKMMHFDHERIPERVVHARGFGAHGEFQVYEDLSEYTSADFLTHPEKTTPVFVRFSTVQGSKGSPDTVFVNGKTVIEFQRSSISISEMIQRTMDYLSIGLEVHWILGQVVKKEKGRICLSAFQQAFIQSDKKLGYHFWHYSAKRE
ncbi:competence protein CoiA family protein, partial [Listeria monocytogenes]|uniref:competence protein CoiA family protein n=1 Tax=Listeria monocytogenes TaxID=1639 RepID=UPI003204B2B3